MNPNTLTTLQSEVIPLVLFAFLYSLFEFFLKRILWSQKDELLSRGKIVAQAVVLLIVLTVGTVCYFTVQRIMLYVCLVLAYMLYDFIVPQQPSRRPLEHFVAKQALMAVVLYSIWRMAGPYYCHDWYSSIEEWIFASSPLYEWLQSNLIYMLVLMSAYLFMIDGGTRFVLGILDKFPNLYRKALESLKSKDKQENRKISEQENEINNEEKENAGEWIGILERAITLTFVLTNSYTAIAFALTAKSIARFKELENKDFSEYYLLGTSASVLIAVITGEIVKLILGI